MEQQKRLCRGKMLKLMKKGGGVSLKKEMAYMKAERQGEVGHI